MEPPRQLLKCFGSHVLGLRTLSSGGERTGTKKEQKKKGRREGEGEGGREGGRRKVKGTGKKWVQEKTDRELESLRSEWREGEGTQGIVCPFCWAGKPGEGPRQATGNPY